MPVYKFKGVNQRGQNVRGQVEADSASTAKSQIKKNGIVVISIRDASQAKTNSFTVSKKVDIKTLSAMTRNLATMLKSGIPLYDALDTLSKQITHPVMAQTLVQIKDSVNRGQSLHKSLKHFPKIFNTTYTAMCEAGEVSGNLDIVLLRLAQFTEDQSRLQDKVRSALIYPALMSVFSCLMIIFLLVFVVPKVRVLFEDMTTIPWYSVLLLNLSDFLIQYWVSLIIGVLVVSYMGWKWKSSVHGQKTWDRMSLTFPIFGKLIRSVAISRFARTLSTLLQGGVPVMDALDIVKNVVNNQKLFMIIEKSRDFIARGESLSTPLIQSGEFPPMVTQMIRVGEKTGQLEKMLSQISTTYDNQVRSDIETMTALLEPVMLIIMGGVIAFIVFSTMIPLLQIYSIAGA